MSLNSKIFKSVASTSALSLAILFSGCGGDTSVQKKPFKDGTVYKNIPHNEFQFFIKSKTVSEGKQVWIDPDDLIEVADKDGKGIFAPRKCFYVRINNQLPAIGSELPFNQAIGEDCQTNDITADGDSVVLMYDHLVGLIGGHGIAHEDMDKAFLEARARRKASDLTP